MLNGSRASYSASTDSANAASSTVLLIGPSPMNGMAPPKALGRITTALRPNEALKPTTLHHAAGMRIEPPASVPSANGTSPSATAAALPPEEPPAFLRTSKGVRVRLTRKLSQVPHSPIVRLLVLPMMMAPAFSIRPPHRQYHWATQ